jgi:hypothetical protein
LGSASASGGGHIYLVDRDGRKIAAIWGKAEEKAATADLIIAAVNAKAPAQEKSAEKSAERRQVGEQVS